MAREIVHTTDLWHKYTKQASASTSSTVINLTVSHWIDMVNWSSQNWQKCSGALECCAKLLVDGPWLQWLPKKSTSDNDFLNITAFKIFVFLFDQSSSLLPGDVTGTRKISERYMTRSIFTNRTCVLCIIAKKTIKSFMEAGAFMHQLNWNEFSSFYSF